VREREREGVVMYVCVRERDEEIIRQTEISI
jgi:hypothetical protein